MLTPKSVLLIILLCTSQSFQSLINDAPLLYEEFEKEIVDSLLPTIAMLKDYLHIVDSIDLYIKKGRLRISNTYKALADELSDFKQLALRNHVRITQCTEHKEREFIEMYKLLYNNLSDCIKHEINNTLDIVKNSKKVIADTWSIVTAIGDELRHCGRNTICLADVISKSNIQSDVLLKRISDQFFYANENVQPLQSSLEMCIHSKLKSLAIDGANLVAQINECIDEKIRNNTNSLMH